VTNSVRHAGPAGDELVRVGAAISDGVLRLKVDNPGTAGAIAVREPDVERGGFGLRLLEALAEAWGVSGDGHARVWAELLCGASTSATDGSRLPGAWVSAGAASPSSGG
jgi:two-component sensor histidine kinase